MSVRRDGAGRTALVTGASAGIGAAFARLLATQGFDVVLTARRADRLSALAGEIERESGIRARVVIADLARPDAPAELIAQLQKDGVVIDFLVNNAGYALGRSYRNTGWQAQRDFLQVMAIAPCEFAHRLLPGMMERRFGRIVNVSSIAGLVPGARGSTLYGASKALLISFTQSLHAEQKGTGVYVSALCPGFTYTEFHDVRGTREVINRLPKFLWLKADEVVATGYRAVMRNQAVCVPGVQYKAITALVRLVPRGLAHRIASAL